jgi:hypothetical protein
VTSLNNWRAMFSQKKRRILELMGEIKKDAGGKSMTKRKIDKISAVSNPSADYGSMLSDVVQLLDESRRAAARSINAIMTATY